MLQAGSIGGDIARLTREVGKKISNRSGFTEYPRGGLFFVNAKLFL
jgi:hypothetical protein